MASRTEWGSDPEFFGPRHAEREALMARVLLPLLPPSPRVLDAGAGSGSFVRLLARHGATAVGVDASAKFVEYAAIHAASAPAFLQGDLLDLPFPDGEFDAVVAAEVLEHLDDHARAVAELRRVLKPGGVALATVPADSRLWDASDEWAGHVRRYDPGELERLFADAGFKVERVFRWGFPLVRLYHRWLYLPMLARKTRDARIEKPMSSWKKGASRLMALAFRFDRLFDGSPWGIGWMMVARKPLTPS